MSESPLLVTRSRITSNGTVYLDSHMRQRMKLAKGEEVEVRYIEAYQGSKNSIILISKVESHGVKGK